MILTDESTVFACFISTFFKGLGMACFDLWDTLCPIRCLHFSPSRLMWAAFLLSLFSLFPRSPRFTTSHLCSHLIIMASQLLTPCNTDGPWKFSVNWSAKILQDVYLHTIPRQNSLAHRIMHSLCRFHCNASTSRVHVWLHVSATMAHHMLTTLE